VSCAVIQHPRTTTHHHNYLILLAYDISRKTSQTKSAVSAIVAFRLNISIHLAIGLRLKRKFFIRFVSKPQEKVLLLLWLR
jgi:hypothetical protein